MALNSRKKSRQDRMMHSKSFEMQDVREIGWKEAGEPRGFPILCMGIIEDVFQMEGKKCKEENPCQSKQDALAYDKQLCLGQWQWTRKGWRQLQKIQWGRKESRRTSEIPQSTWLSGAQKGS